MDDVLPATRRVCARPGVISYLLHDAGFALRKGDVTTRLILNELDLNLPALAARLVVVVVIVVSSSAGARTLDASALAVAILEVVVLVVSVGGILRDNLGRHGAGALEDECGSLLVVLGLNRLRVCVEQEVAG
jgi:small neutral amino acid transporter SnatA (MarC family)